MTDEKNDEMASRIFAPPSGSREKFRSRFDAAIVQDRRQLLALKAATGAMVLVLGFFIFSPHWGESSSFGEAKNLLESDSAPKTEISANAVEAARSPGVRLYLLMR